MTDTRDKFQNKLLLFTPFCGGLVGVCPRGSGRVDQLAGLLMWQLSKRTKALLSTLDNGQQPVCDWQPTAGRCSTFVSIAVDCILVLDCTGQQLLKTAFRDQWIQQLQHAIG